MCEQGQQTPVMVIRGEAQPFVLIDGYARVQALRTLAKDLVEATVLDLPEVEALVMGVGLDNARQRSALEEGWFLRELVEAHGLSLEVLARKLFLQAEAATRTGEQTPPDQQVAKAIKELGVITGLCIRTRRRLDEPGVAARGEHQRRGLRRAFTDARDAFGSLSARLEEQG